MRWAGPLSLLSLWCATCASCASCASPAATARTAHPSPDPAPTPAAALIAMWEATASGDAAAYRRTVLFRPPADYVQAQARMQLASARLQRAVRDHAVTGKRVRDAGFDRNETLLVRGVATGEELEQARRAIEQMEWKIQGNIATPAHPLSASGSLRVERLGDGWIVVATDPVDDLSPRAARHLVNNSRLVADITDAATARVTGGELRTIRDINEFIEGQRKAAQDRAAAALKSGCPKGPLVVVTDVETGHPIAGAKVGGRYLVPPGLKWLDVTTDYNGRARLPSEPDSVHDLSVRAPGYALREADVSTVATKGDRITEVHIAIGKPAVVEVTLVLPDDRRAALSVYEGEGHDPAPPGLRDRLEPKRLVVPVAWEDPPPELPQHNPTLRLNLFSGSPHAGVQGVVHRVTAARTKAGRELPVFRDGPPPDEATFGLYDIGSNGFADAVFVIGTLADARAAEGAAMNFQWSRNDGVLGPATQPARGPGAKRGGG